MRWCICLCIENLEPEEADNHWLPDPDMLTRTTPNPVLATEYNMEPEDGELQFSPNIELVFYEPPPNKARFSKRLGTLPGSPFILEGRRTVRTPSMNLWTTSPENFYVDESTVNYHVPNSRSSIIGGSPIPWDMDSYNDTEEQELEESEIITPLVVFTPNRSGKKYQPITPRRIYLENIEPQHSIITRSKVVSQTEGLWMRQILSADESTTDQSSLIHFQSTGSSDMESASHPKNSLYSTETMADKECVWATFEPVTPKSGYNSSESSTVVSCSGNSHLEFKINSHCQDELKINENSKLSKYSEIDAKEVITIRLADDSI